MIESASQKLGLPASGLTLAQFNLRKVKVVSCLGQMIGISVGCILGLIPLLFIDQHEAHLHAVFDALDEDGSGTIDVKEIKHCLEQTEIRFPAEVFESLMAEIDKSEDGQIDFEEFKAFMVKLESIVQGDVLVRGKTSKFVGWVHQLFD